VLGFLPIPVYELLVLQLGLPYVLQYSLVSLHVSHPSVVDVACTEVELLLRHDPPFVDFLTSCLVVVGDQHNLYVLRMLAYNYPPCMFELFN
jgi:hypothetical protein